MKKFEKPLEKNKMNLLHIGCGGQAKHHFLTRFRSDEWNEIRFDYTDKFSPDIVGLAQDLSGFQDGSVDAIYTSHVIEHMELPKAVSALREFNRVIKDDGFCVTIVPDLKAAAAMIADGKIFETAYVSPSGPINPLDIIFGDSKTFNVAPGDSHLSGYTKDLLTMILKQAGFARVYCAEASFQLFSLAVKDRDISDEDLLALINDYLVVNKDKW